MYKLIVALAVVVFKALAHLEEMCIYTKPHNLSRSEEVVAVTFITYDSIDREFVMQ